MIVGDIKGLFGPEYSFSPTRCNMPNSQMKSSRRSCRPWQKEKMEIQVPSPSVGSEIVINRSCEAPLKWRQLNRESPLPSGEHRNPPSSPFLPLPPAGFVSQVPQKSDKTLGITLLSMKRGNCGIFLGHYMRRLYFHIGCVCALGLQRSIPRGLTREVNCSYYL